MAGRWLVVLLVFLLSAGGSSAVDQNKLAKLIGDINNQYRFGSMFAVALSIKSEDPTNLEQIFHDNPKEVVEHTVTNGFVYRGSRFAVATVGQRQHALFKDPDHAEYRLLKDLKLDSDDGDLLVIYSYGSPCPLVCTNKNNPKNIITLIKNVINTGRWSEHVFVFQKVFWPRKSLYGIEEQVLAKALEELGTSGIPLANIFRYYRPNAPRSSFQCTSCSKDGKVAQECIDYYAKK